MKRSNLLAGAAMRLRRLIGFAVPLLLLLGGAQGAWAACVRDVSANPQTFNIGMGRVIVRNDLPLNGIIAIKSVTLTAVVGWYCPTPGVVSGVVLQGTPLSSDSTIYSTTVPGVGIRVSGYVGSYPNRYEVSGEFKYLALSGEITVQLIKTAAVTGTGPQRAGIYTQLYGDGDRVSLATTLLGANDTVILSPACSVDVGSRNIPVAFGKVPVTSFKGKGSTAVDRNFSIKLNCKGGQNAQSTVLLRMDALADPSTVQGVLRLTQAGTATAGGVGIQVVDGTAKAPVKFGDAMVVGPSKEGSYVLPYTARYYQTGDRVAPGQANGTATFTLDYR